MKIGNGCKEEPHNWTVDGVIKEVIGHKSEIENDYSHCIVFIDAQNADLEIRDTKKEADKLTVSRSAQRLFSGNSGLEQEARSHVRQLKDTILAELVNINDDAKMSYGDYIRAINESATWNTII